MFNDSKYLTRWADFAEHGVRRFQYCYWWEKLWRMRWLLMIPVMTFRRWGHKWGDGLPLSFEQLWSCNHGTAHMKMEYWYTHDEVKEHFNER
jgi:hypothetical protein